MRRVILPTAVNVLTHMVAQIVAARRAGVPSEVTLTTLRQRAWQIVHETSVLHIAPATEG